MPTLPKHHLIHPGTLERDSIRVTQMNAAQDMLFAMRELGERTVSFQLEIEGVMQVLVCRCCTQMEFPGVVESLEAANARNERRGESA